MITLQHVYNKIHYEVSKNDKVHTSFINKYWIFNQSLRGEISFCLMMKSKTGNYKESRQIDRTTTDRQLKTDRQIDTQRL